MTDQGALLLGFAATEAVNAGLDTAAPERRLALVVAKQAVSKERQLTLAGIESGRRTLAVDSATFAAVAVGDEQPYLLHQGWLGAPWFELRAPSGR